MIWILKFIVTVVLVAGIQRLWDGAFEEDERMQELEHRRDQLPKQSLDPFSPGDVIGSIDLRGAIAVIATMFALLFIFMMWVP